MTKGEETSKRIRLKASQLFIEKGYENTSVKEICRDAEVAVGTFYHHFSSKKNIVEGETKIINDKYRQMIMEISIIDPEEFIQLFIKTVMEEWQLYEKVLVELIADYFFEVGNNGYVIKDNFLHESICNKVKEGIEIGTFDSRYDPFMLTEKIIMYVMTTVLLWVRNDIEKSLSKRTEDELKFFFRLIKLEN